MFEAGHSLCSKQDILCLRSKTFLVLEARRSLCAKQDIDDSVCSKHDIPCVRIKTFLVFKAEHSLCPRKKPSLCSKPDIACVRSRTFLVLRTRHLRGSNHEKCTCHFLSNSADRPEIWANHNQIRANPGTIGQIELQTAPKWRG